MLSFCIYVNEKPVNSPITRFSQNNISVEAIIDKTMLSYLHFKNMYCVLAQYQK